MTVTGEFTPPVSPRRIAALGTTPEQRSWPGSTLARVITMSAYLRATPSAFREERDGAETGRAGNGCGVTLFRRRA